MTQKSNFTHKLNKHNHFKVMLAFLLVLSTYTFSNVTGTVKDFITGKVLENVSVAETQYPAKKVYTNAQGRFVLPVSTTSILPKSKKWNVEISLDKVLNLSGLTGHTRARLSNLQGVTLWESKTNCSDQQCQFSLPTIEHGLYFLVITNEKAKFSFKWVNTEQPLLLSISQISSFSSSPLKKQAVYPVTIAFEKDGYKRKGLTVNNGSDIQVVLAPNPDTSGTGKEGSTCGTGGPMSNKIVRVDIGENYYMIGAPVSNKPLPLLLVLHGDEGHPRNVQSIWQSFWESKQDFIMVLPKAPTLVIDDTTKWDRWGIDFDTKVEFIRNVLDDVGSKYSVDVSRIYATGYSGGTEFLGTVGLLFHDTFAAINFSCGGGGWVTGKGLSDVEPPRPECKFDARIYVAKDDFLYNSALNLQEFLKERTISVDFNEAKCSGHCCHDKTWVKDEVEPAWNWLSQRKKCGVRSTKKCVGIRALP